MEKDDRDLTDTFLSKKRSGRISGEMSIEGETVMECRRESGTGCACLVLACRVSTWSERHIKHILASQLFIIVQSDRSTRRTIREYNTVFNITESETGVCEWTVRHWCLSTWKSEEECVCRDICSVISEDAVRDEIRGIESWWILECDACSTKSASRVSVVHNRVWEGEVCEEKESEIDTLSSKLMIIAEHESKVHPRTTQLSLSSLSS